MTHHTQHTTHNAHHTHTFTHKSQDNTAHTTTDSGSLRRAHVSSFHGGRAGAQGLPDSLHMPCISSLRAPRLHETPTQKGPGPLESPLSRSQALRAPRLDETPSQKKRRPPKPPLSRIKAVPAPGLDERPSQEAPRPHESPLSRIRAVRAPRLGEKSVRGEGTHR